MSNPQGPKPPGATTMPGGHGQHGQHGQPGQPGAMPQPPSSPPAAGVPPAAWPPPAAPPPGPAQPYAPPGPAQPYAQPGQPAQPYAQPGPAQPYAQPGQPAPYAQPGQPAQPYGQPGQPAPYAQPGQPVPRPGSQAGWSPPAAPPPGPAQPYGQPGPAQGYAPPGAPQPLPQAVAHWQGGHGQGHGHGHGGVAAPPPGTVPGGPAVPAAPADAGMFKKSLGRALRLRIEPNEISPDEARALTSASPPITEPHLQAFLAWRRSVLFLVAVALLPLTALRFYDAFQDDFPEQLRFIALVPAAAEGFLCAVCWYQLKHWMHWRKQRRALFRAWVLFMAAPFIVFLIPMDPIIEDFVRSQVGGDMAMEAGGEVSAEAIAQVAWALKLTISIYALMTLAPKAVSLLAGTIRAGIVTKMLFPGTSGPGWIVVLATPLYTLFVFTLLIVPYQITGSGWYVGAMLGLMAAQIALGRAGYALAKPTTHDDAVKLVAKARATYLISMAGFGACLLVALGTMASQLGVSTIITTALSFEANVLILTLIGSDLVITSLDRARGLSTGTAHLVEASNQQLNAFVGEGDASASR